MAGFQLEPASLFAGDYRIVRPLSEGGMGAVYVAEQLSTRAERALKLMHPELVSRAALRARFEQEARVAAQIPSDHVVQVIAAGVDQDTGMPWLAMELLDGTDLLEAAATGRAGPAVLREIMSQLCHALGAAHDLGIVHRDLKPENIFLAAPRRAGTPFTVKVLDFGIAKMTSEARGMTETASVGTPLWMAPEQAGASKGLISPATDVWALGLLAFWLLTRRYYWRSARQDGVTLEALFREVLIDPLVPASVRAREVESKTTLPPGFDAWFARAVARDPSARFADARAAFAALEQVLTQTAEPIALERSSKPGVSKTLIDDAPAPLTTPGAPPVIAMTPAPSAQPLPVYAPPPTPPVVLTPAWDQGGAPLARQSPSRSGGCAIWAFLALGFSALATVAAVLTFDTWQPALIALLADPADAVPETPPQPAPVECPAGTRKEGNRCIKLIDKTCPPGTKFTTRGCVAILAEPDSVATAQEPTHKAKDDGNKTPTSPKPTSPKPTSPAPAKVATARLLVSCSPACTSVRANGIALGASPVTRYLPVGSYTIRGDRAGYVTRTSYVTLKANSTHNVVLKLTPTGGTTTKK